MILGTAALVWLLAAPADGAQDRHGRAVETDQTTEVSRGTRLAVENFAGSVQVRTWERDSVRVQARHSPATKVLIRAADNAITVSCTSKNGPAEAVEYHITAPSWMAMRIEGQHTDVTIEGSKGDVSVETVRGDISITRASGSVTGETIEGQVTIEGGRGKVDVSSVNESIKITGASGEITAETTNGSISLTRVEASDAEVATINGDVVFDGPLADNGHYSFSSHNGDISVTIPETSNATFNVRTYNGEFNTSLPLKGPEPSRVRRGRRVSFTLGAGSADVELESFGGEISVRRPGTAAEKRQ